MMMKRVHKSGGLVNKSDMLLSSVISKEKREKNGLQAVESVTDRF